MKRVKRRCSEGSSRRKAGGNQFINWSTVLFVIPMCFSSAHVREQQPTAAISARTQHPA
jgi:hypothetical protein